MSTDKTYLGDGCSAEITVQGIVLTTSNGIENTNTIVLEPDVWSSLLRFVASASARRASEPNGDPKVTP